MLGGRELLATDIGRREGLLGGGGGGGGLLATDVRRRE